MIYSVCLVMDKELKYWSILGIVIKNIVFEERFLMSEKSDRFGQKIFSKPSV